MLRDERTNSFEAAVLGAFDGLQSRLWTALPGLVESVDLGKQTLVVQPAIQAQIMNPNNTWTWVTLPLLLDVPIVFPTGGGFTLTFPVVVGDECLVIFSSRCIDAWWQSGGIQVQAELRMHDLSDGFAIVGPRSQPRKLANVSANSTQLRNEDDSIYVEVSAAGIKLKGNVVLEGTFMVNGFILDERHTHNDVEAGLAISGNVTA